MVSAVGRLVGDSGPSQPQALLERSRRPGRSAGALARILEEFFLAEGLAFGLDQEARLAAGRRQRRVQAVPVSLRPAVGAFADHLVRSRERALRAGTRPRKDITIEHNLGIVRDLARFLATERSKQEWAVMAVDDIEAFLGAQPSNRRRRLQASRQFFGWARKNKLVLVDPTKGLTSLSRWGFVGETLSLTEQRRLFRRWSGADAHPHEALVGTPRLVARSVQHRAAQLAGRRLRRGPLHAACRPAHCPGPARPSQRLGPTPLPRPPCCHGHP